MLVWWSYRRRARIGSWRKFFLCRCFIVVRWWQDGKLVVLDLEESGRQIGENCLLCFLLTKIRNWLSLSMTKAKLAEPISDRNPGRWLVFLLRAAFCYCTRPGDSADGQGIWNLLFAHTESKASIHLWNAYRFGVERRVHLLFPQGCQQPYQ